MAKIGPTPNIDQLSEKLLINIFSKMSISDLTPVRQVSRDLSKLTRDKNLLEELSHSELLKIISLVKRQYLFIDNKDIEEYLNLVWGNSYFETYRLTWKEYLRELDCLNIQYLPIVRDLEFKIEYLASVTPQLFLSTNNFLVQANLNACFNNRIVTLKAGATYDFNFERFGLTRVLLETLKMAAASSDIDIYKLNLSRNFIKNLPDSLWSQKIVDLNLSDNEIEAIPEALQELTGLQQLNLTKNNISTFSAKNRKIIRTKCTKTITEILESQKNFTLNHELSVILLKYILLPILLVYKVSGTQPQEGILFQSLHLLISEIIYLNFFISPFNIIYHLFSVISHHEHLNSRTPLRERMIEYFANATPVKLQPNTDHAIAYDIGRESSKSWSPYFKSLGTPKSYSKEYYAGLDDERNSLPSRTQSSTFKEKARKEINELFPKFDF